MQFDDKAVEAAARAIDPDAWKDDLPIPTRADTVKFHERRQKSAQLARSALDAALSTIPAPAGTAEAVEMIATADQWAKKAFDWSGSAFIADEQPLDDGMSEADHKAALYTDLCHLGHHMSWLGDQLRALHAAPPAAVPPAWTEETLRKEANRRGWYVRESASVPDIINGGWKYPFSLTMSSSDLLEMLAPAASLPDGWVAVPREPTPEMIEAGQSQHPAHSYVIVKDIFRAMLAARPAAPANAEGGE